MSFDIWFDEKSFHSTWSATTPSTKIPSTIKTLQTLVLIQNTEKFGYLLKKKKKFWISKEFYDSWFALMEIKSMCLFQQINKCDI